MLHSSSKGVGLLLQLILQVVSDFRLVIDMFKIQIQVHIDWVGDLLCSSSLGHTHWVAYHLYISDQKCWFGLCTVFIIMDMLFLSNNWLLKWIEGLQLVVRISLFVPKKFDLKSVKQSLVLLIFYVNFFIFLHIYNCHFSFNRRCFINYIYYWRLLHHFAHVFKHSRDFLVLGLNIWQFIQIITSELKVILLLYRDSMSIKFVITRN